MGRPKLNVQQVTVYLTPETVGRIEALVGRHARSIFIRRAIEKALAEAERSKVVDVA